jgi:LPXTG-motif cell wall-anchored protein
MTPPRSEAWALCLGGGLAMLWYMARNKFNSSLRVALFTTLGAGFGFAFGNFLQTVGTVLQINFNMWNVMEYSIGFFGGTTMAYTIFTSKWPETEKSPKRWENQVAFLFLVALIPLIIFRESVQYSELVKRMANLPNTEQVANLTAWVGALILSSGIFIAWFFRANLVANKENTARKTFFAAYFGIYIVLSYLVTGVLAGSFHLNHHLYVVNFIVIFILLNRVEFPVVSMNIRKMNYGKYRLLFFTILVIIALLALVSTSIHDGMNGAHNRFEF